MKAREELQKNYVLKPTERVDDFVVGYELEWEEGMRLIMAHMLWSSVTLLIALLV